MVKVDLQAIEGWYAERRKDYVLQFNRTIKKRSKTKPRKRVLDREKELPFIWAAAGKAGIFGALIKLLLFTAQRRQTVIMMRWDQVNLDTGEWLIPVVDRDREKGHPERLMLPPAALSIIKEQMRISPYIFPSTRGGHLAGLSQLKRSFDARLPSIPGWTLHDLRRTSRTLMTQVKIKAGDEEVRAINSDVAEAILGHKRGGVEAIYDRYEFELEMKVALERLADHIEKIVGENVVPMAQAG